MSVAALLYDLGAAGITIVARGDRLRFYPRDALGPDLLARLQAHKAELLGVLRDTARKPGGTDAAQPDALDTPAADDDHDPTAQWDDLQDAADVPGCPTCP